MISTSSPQTNSFQKMSEEEKEIDCYNYICEDELYQTLVTEKSDNTSLILSVLRQIRPGKKKKKFFF